MNWQKRKLALILTILLLSSCQSRTILPLSPTIEIVALQSVSAPSATAEPTTQLPTMTPTFAPIPETSLAGLVISSPILGAPYEVPGVEPSTLVTPNGLGIINAEGKLIPFSDGGIFEGFSPSGVHLVYQRGFEHEYNDFIDNLYAYNAVTGETIELVDDLENEGGKRVLSWSQDERTLLYYNDYETVLFEAYGYFRPKQLLSADVITGHTKLLINDGYQFAVSPDQTRIAYTTGRLLDSKTEQEQGRSFGCFQPRIYNLNTASSQAFDVSQLSETPACLGYPQWSPDGKKLAWMGYFEDETFRPVVFHLQDHVARVYDPLEHKPRGSRGPTDWFFGEPSYGGDFEPAWMDDSVFWTPSYEVNVETGETATPRVRERLYNPRWNEDLENPDGTLRVSLTEERDTILIHDRNGDWLGSFLVDGLYEGPRWEILTSPFFSPGRNQLVSWSAFIPPSNTGNP
jgi:Periplasmic component of the Tol biopolymer transport system